MTECGGNRDAHRAWHWQGPGPSHDHDTMGGRGERITIRAPRSRVTARRRQPGRADGASGLVKIMLSLQHPVFISLILTTFATQRWHIECYDMRGVVSRSTSNAFVHDLPSSKNTMTHLRLRGGSSKQAKEPGRYEGASIDNEMQGSLTLAAMDMDSNENVSNASADHNQQNKAQNYEAISQNALHRWSEALAKESQESRKDEDKPQQIWVLGGRRDEVTESEQQRAGEGRKEEKEGGMQAGQGRWDRRRERQQASDSESKSEAVGEGRDHATREITGAREDRDGGGEGQTSESDSDTLGQLLHLRPDDRHPPARSRVVQGAQGETTAGRGAAAPSSCRCPAGWTWAPCPPG